MLVVNWIIINDLLREGQLHSLSFFTRTPLEPSFTSTTKSTATCDVNQYRDDCQDGRGSPSHGNRLIANQALIQLMSDGRPN